MNRMAKLSCSRSNPVALCARRHIHGVSHHTLTCRLARPHTSLLTTEWTPKAGRPPQSKRTEHPKRQHSLLYAVQQQQETASEAALTASHTDSDFLIDQPQLQKLAQSKGSQLFAGATVANVLQLANALRTSLDFGLVTDVTELQKRAAQFGSNTLPAKQEVS